MTKTQHGFFSWLWEIDRHERIKIVLLGVIFFCIIGSYTLAKELKDSVFMYVVGEKYLPTAKILSMFVLIPAVLFYGYLVDKLKRYQLLYVYSSLYAGISLIFAFCLANEHIGLSNPVPHPTRLLGWLFYFFIEGYTPFILSLFWAYANTISSPRAAQQGYPIIVSFSKVGGMATSALAWYLFGAQLGQIGQLSDITRHQLSLIVSSVLLCLIPVCLKFLLRTVPARFMHGYEAVYQFEKQQERKGEASTPDMVSGLRLLFKYPYVLGIFGMIFFYEVIDTILNNQRLVLTKQSVACMGELTCSLYGQVFFTHFFGFFLSFFATTALLRFFGERWSLLFIPISSVCMLLYFVFFNTSKDSLVFVYQIMTALNMAVSAPIREALYIPTVKEVRYKSKSWIDAFGTKLSKTIGSGFNVLTSQISVAAANSLFGILVGFISVAWLATAYLLGTRFARAVEHNEIIGADSQQ